MTDEPLLRDGWVTPDEVAAATDGEVSAYTVRRLCREGRFPRARKAGRSWVIPFADATVFLSTYDRYRSGDTKYVAEPADQPGTTGPQAQPHHPGEEGS